LGISLEFGEVSFGQAGWPSTLTGRLSQIKLVKTEKSGAGAGFRSGRLPAPVYCSCQL